MAWLRIVLLGVSFTANLPFTISRTKVAREFGSVVVLGVVVFVGFGVRVFVRFGVGVVILLEVTF